MDFFGAGIPIGRYWGIAVRLHFTFILYAIARLTGWENLGMGVAYVAGLYGCILLHEFGHALAARWCDGEAHDIVLWPLGGLAFVRPAWHPTAHLITTVAGPFVTLVLWLLFGSLQWVLGNVVTSQAIALGYVEWFCWAMKQLNFVLLVFNLIPAFPMDGGRILRDSLWHFMSAERATRIAIWTSRILAVAGAALAMYAQQWFLLVFPLFIFLQCSREEQVVAFEAGGTYQFSVRERWRRGRRQRAWRSSVREHATAQETVPMHQCAVCGVTDHASPTMDFRVCTDCSHGEEYCREHLDSHQHV
jgi:Zn-dependent protease